MLAKVETLNKMFEGTYNGTPVIRNGKCHDCGCELTIVIKRTTGGFRLQGGALYEPQMGRFSFKCEACFHINENLNDTDNNIPLEIELSASI